VEALWLPRRYLLLSHHRHHGKTIIRPHQTTFPAKQHPLPSLYLEVKHLLMMGIYLFLG